MSHVIDDDVEERNCRKTFTMPILQIRQRVDAGFMGGRSFMFERSVAVTRRG
jgi:hypothetical protein